ncbi:MAG: Loki-CTERM sorting domain-containing protein [Promethearchaeota archaeon]
MVSPFRNNLIEIYLSIDVITHSLSSGGDGGGGGDASQSEIPGYDLLLFIGFIGIGSIIIIKKINKKFK